MPVTYKKIASVTVGAGGAANIDFTSIPSTFTDIMVHISTRSARTTGGSDSLAMNINNASTNRTWRQIEGNGATVTSSNNTTTYIANLPQDGGTTGWTANTFASIMVYIPNYAGSTNKSFSVEAVTENNATTSYQNLIAGLWSQTTAINQLTFLSGTANNLVQYSTATLYGISKS